MRLTETLRCSLFLPLLSYVRIVVGEAAQSRQVPDAAAAPSTGVSHAPLAHDPNDGDVDDDDRESTISVTADRSAVCLANFVYDTYPGSRPVAPRCDFEALYALSDPPESSILALLFTRGFPIFFGRLMIALLHYRGALNRCLPSFLRRFADMRLPILSISPLLSRSTLISLDCVGIRLCQTSVGAPLRLRNCRG